MTEPQLTQERIDAAARDDIVIFKWLQKTLGSYRASPENGKAVIAYLQSKRLPITEDALDAAFESLMESGIIFAEEPDAPPAPPQPKLCPCGCKMPQHYVPQHAPPPPSPYPWKFELTKKWVRDASVAEIKKHLKSREYGKQFEEALNDLKITRGDVRR